MRLTRSVSWEEFLPALLREDGVCHVATHFLCTGIVQSIRAIQEGPSGLDKVIHDYDSFSFRIALLNHDIPSIWIVWGPGLVAGHEIESLEELLETLLGTCGSNPWKEMADHPQLGSTTIRQEDSPASGKAMQSDFGPSCRRLNSLSRRLIQVCRRIKTWSLFIDIGNRKREREREKGRDVDCWMDAHEKEKVLIVQPALPEIKLIRQSVDVEDTDLHRTTGRERDLRRTYREHRDE